MDNIELVTKFFEDAKTGGGLQYLMTLLRVRGLESYEEDPATVFISLLNNQKEIDNLTLLKSIVGNFIWLSVIANLDNNSRGQNYIPFPFGLTYPETLKSSREDNLFLSAIYKQTKDQDSQIKQKLQELFGDELFTNTEVDLNSISQEYPKKRLTNIVLFVKDFMSVYKKILLNFKDDAGFMKTADFTAIEFLRNDKVGLIGFKAHFSNGSNAEYTRSNTGVTALNLMTKTEGVGFMVGDLGKLTHHWMVGDKPLYQIGANGRYNKFGEWKPLEYPGPAGSLEIEVKKLLGDIEDPKRNVYGCLQYIVATCHRNIEFIVKGDFELPHQPTVYTSGFGDIYLHKLDLGEQASNFLGNQRIYDCSVTVPEVTAETIQEGIFNIQYFISELAFALDVKAEWFLKYPMSQEIRGVLNVKEKDIDELNKYISNEKISFDDRQVVAAAISWFVNGSNSNNIYTSYLCYYIAFEIVASALARGGLDISDEYGFKKKSKPERKAIRKECVTALHDAEYISDPIKFVEDAYFSCVTSIRKDTESAIKSVFGKEHKYIKDFYEETEGVSISSLRSNLAHGRIAFIDTDDEKAVRQKLPILRDIAHEFITRVSHGLKPGDEFKKPSISRNVMFSMSDPRTTGVTNSLEMLPLKDWSIRPEWLL